MKLIEAVQRASARLEQAGVCFGHGTTNAWDEAAWLVLWRLGLPLDDLDGAADRALAADEQAAVDALISERIARRQPAAYLTGEAWLQGVPFTVDERVIVPRSLIAETIADGTLDAWLASCPFFASNCALQAHAACSTCAPAAAASRCSRRWHGPTCRSMRAT